ncbi:putative capsular polysaccharide synthesis family protein [Microcystis aeruginosa]|uniref:Sulfotransferase family protein n=1 Tax=Microcystis aeruginosa (strain NIES-843 / IAM M-2473) TaxID=449447 RepID=B0JLU1_MICAN|nr:putative capsular polysaccharide synthesis family protein [Microcystis aeruginosa]BAG03115.1 hypothetical protein MAE_32930 [Microcystis aeruginosa NIES-843]
MSKLLDNLTYLRKIVLQDIKLRFRLYATNQTPIIIYQMGKVGSSSVMKSLKKKAILPLFHVHFLLKNADNRSFYNPNVYEILSVKLEREMLLRQGKFLYNKIIAPKKQVKIISLTREPIGRNVAAFFQNFERETGKKYEQSNFTPQELRDIFINFFPHSTPLDWFDNYFKPFLGIDVYEYPFPKEQGYLRINKDNVDLLILKLETSDSVKEKAIAEFLGLKEFKLVRTNVGEDKNYGSSVCLMQWTGL